MSAHSSVIQHQPRLGTSALHSAAALLAGLVTCIPTCVSQLCRLNSSHPNTTSLPLVWQHHVDSGTDEVAHIRGTALVGFCDTRIHSACRCCPFACFHSCVCSGFTSVAQYLDSKAATTADEAKVSVAAVLAWLLMAGAMVVPLGGLSTYTDSLSIFTDGGLEMGNLVFLWVAILGYYSIKVS